MFFASVAVVLFYASDAQAFRHTMTCTQDDEYRCTDGASPKPLRWSARCVSYQINEDALESVVDSADALNDIHGAVAKSFRAWSDVDCSDLTLVDAGMSETDTPRGNARSTNLVMWRSKGWEKLASAQAFALTSVTFNPRNGLIANADIQVNTELYSYSASDMPQPSHVDLQNTLTHEVGHFIGLDHSDLRKATMYSTATVGETAKRTLHPDDINGLCATYPIRTDNPPQCLRASEFPSEADIGLNQPSCSTAAGSARPRTATILILLGLLLLVMRNGRRLTLDPKPRTRIR